MSRRLNVGIIITAIVIATTIGATLVSTTMNSASAQMFYQGPPGRNGTQGPIGPPGAAAPTMNLAVRNVPGQIVALNQVAQSIATCNSDELVIGGGFSIANGPGMVLSSVPIDNSWAVFAANPFAIDNSSLQAFAECAKSN
jgi:hypothetical protein